MKRLKLLVANDDGISVGLKALADAAASVGHDVFIATTRNHSSGAGKSISFKTRYEVTTLFDNYTAVIVDSTPATAVGVVLDSIRRDFDLVLSGVNSGPNLGLWDVLSSGTVGAVLEAATRGVRGIAVSLVAREWSEYPELSYRDYYKAAKLVIDMFEALSDVQWKAPVLNINVPSWGIRGVREAVLETEVQSEVYTCSNNHCDMSRWTLDEAYKCSTPGSDVCLVKQGYATVTPLIFACSTTLDWIREALQQSLK
ncbi:MAG: 5'/3'-nucleotidase SurE [Infirmifilum sp.]